MAILETGPGPCAPSFLDDLDTAIARACEGGGEKQVTRHHAQGKLLPRERIELLVDRDSAFLELSTLAGYGTGHPVGAGVVTGIAVIAGRPCVVVAGDATVPGGSFTEYSTRKVARAAEIALVNELPMVTLADPDGPDPRHHARLRAAGVPTVCAVFGSAPGLTLPAQPEDLIVVRGPEDERDAVRLVRQAVQRLAPRPEPVRRPVVPPRLDADDLLAVAGGEVPFDPREVLGRILDGSEFDEVAPLYGSGLCAGFGSVHGYRVGVLAGVRPTVGVDELAKANRFVGLTAAARVPLISLNAPPMEAVAAGPGPMITIVVGGAHRPVGQGFVFSWPTAASALHRSGQLDDDGVIDPRDTRTVLGICLSVLPTVGSAGRAA